VTQRRLVVGRSRFCYRMPARAPGRDELRARLDGSFRDQGAGLAASAVAALVPSGDGVVVVRRASVRLRMGPASRPDVVGRAWTVGVAAAVEAALCTGSDDVVRFPDRASYVARFVEESVAGAAPSRWWLESFGGRVHEPPAVAVPAVLRADPSSAAAVLAALARARRLAWVAASIGERAAAEVVASLPVGVDQPHALTALATAVRTWPDGARGLPGPEAVALYLAGVVAAAKGGGGLGPAEARAVTAVAKSWEALAALPSRGRSEAAAAADVILRRAALRVPSTTADLPVAVEPGEGPEAGVTRFGGVFLLLPALAVVLGDVEHDDLAAARYAVLLTCFGPGARRLARHDGGLVAAAGLDAPPDALAGAVERAAVILPADPDDLKPNDAAHVDTAWLGWRGPAVADTAAAVLRAFARGLPGFANAGFAHLAENFLTGAARFTTGPDGLVVTLPDVPLKVVLHLAGWRGNRFEIDWLPGGALTVEGEAG
jgi:hypothetical protein